ncbi:hypothetical protein [Spirosoma foliorum]|uniref:Uncharacterized protein n=1 Tax=Spirosoma foliorum TaxID=2710596 RepID=A0A7G5H5H2_9BACT|nr:hypothetical protein [Spirosoma foliorum]QMW06364.1 hypothetical protein H3H32_16470 [Spirosoma foliorum]
MNTEQNYVGGGNNAIPPTPPAQNAVPTSPTPDDWRDSFLLEVMKSSGSKEYLFGLLELIHDLLDSGSIIPSIGEMFNGYITQPYINLSEQRLVLRDMMSLVVFLTKLKGAFECFDIYTDYIKIAESEQGNE